MATFKKQKKFVKPTAAAASSKKEYDFGSDFEDSSSANDSEEEAAVANDNDSDDETGGGVNIISFLNLQKSLRRATEQKIELSDKLRDTNEKLRKTDYELNRASDTNRRQIAILRKAQNDQLGDYTSIIGSLKLSIEEMEDTNGESTNGMNQLVETLKNSVENRRELDEKCQTLEMQLEQAEQDKTEMDSANTELTSSLKSEITEMRASLDPIKIDNILSNIGSSSSAETSALRAELSKVQDQLQIIEAQKVALENDANSMGNKNASFTVSDAEMTAKKTEITKLQNELKDARVQLASLKASSESGASAGVEAQSLNDTLRKELADLKKSLGDKDTEADELKTSLRSEESAHSIVKDELADLKSHSQNAAKQGQSSQEQMSNELAAEKSALKAEKAGHEASKSELAEVKAQWHSTKESASSNEAKLEEDLQQERQRHAGIVQTNNAAHAAELAEVNQRSLDETKDLRDKLSNFADVLRPMMGLVKNISTDYRSLRSEARELQATVEPATKQVKRDMLKTLAEVDKQYKEMLTKYRKEMALRKKLHNELVDLKGNIRVFCRIRPIISEDGNATEKDIAIKTDPRDDQLALCVKDGKKSQFDYDIVFGRDSAQVDVYNRAMDLITSVIDGFNVCIFAYGQTGSGKTFTMEGNDAHPGLNRRALKGLFDVCDEKKSDWSYEFEASVMEIYNENIVDLLDPKNGGGKMDIKLSKTGPHVPGLTRKTVRSQDEVNDWFGKAKKNRSTSSTKMNDQSSRSHCLLVVYVVGTNLSTGVQTTGKLNLIDLAGSERVGKSGAIDDEKRLKEAMSINKSLSSLGDVISALGAKAKHVPFRNSKLTFLLQDSLGGAAKTLMVVQISPVTKNIQESICSLKFAERVKKVELGTAKKSTESAEMAALKKRIRELEG